MYGFIKTTKARAGKKNQNNRYQILDKAYSLEINPKAKITKVQETMICNSCWDDVEAPNIQVFYSESWEGRREVIFRHIGCTEKNNSEELIPITETSRRTQQWNQSILERAKLNWAMEWHSPVFSKTVEFVFQSNRPQGLLRYAVVTAYSLCRRVSTPSSWGVFPPLPKPSAP